MSKWKPIHERLGLPDLRGENGPRAKLTWPQVGEIRQLALTTPQAAIARRFGVSLSAINAIVLGKRWEGAADHLHGAGGELYRDCRWKGVDPLAE
jgi:hypothetical protein